ncbi:MULTISPECIES: TolC family protein [Phocaeicola]|uniref:TolC family protein n=1 Tax=Phocaeicola acetigenes TaxID=3016083 RepID=A0ABT4PHM6_9BACT|nr:TolC family protein [Phocaeicola sp. KGMB11183]MCZ8372521.1 TolC family protein [Phocaeicola sp. KGMB11183]
MRKQYMIGVVGLFLAGSLQAQNIADVLQSIERNNKELQAQLQLTEAAKMEVQTQNSLSDPTIDYSPFFAKGVDGVASSELVVSQEFDFPTLYAARRQSGKLQQEVLDRQQQAVRRSILLDAKNLCLDLIRLNQEKALLDARKKNADELLTLFEKRLQEGDAGILEVNKIKMERMNVQTEVTQNNAAHRTALQSLLAMNGNLPLEFTADTYPQIEKISDYNALYDEIMLTDADLLASDAAARAAAKEVSVNKQNWLPKLSVGYRRNTSLDEKSNGFLIGGSIPLFSNRKKVKIARAQEVGARLQLDNARLQAEATVQSRYNEVLQLQEAMKAYDVPLMHETLDMLKQAVMAGQLSIIEYYVEVDGVYRNLQAYIQIENQYQKLMADIYKNRL